MNIRTAGKQDLDSIFPLSKRMGTSFSVEYESFRNSFMATLGSEDARIVVAETDDKIVGYLLGFDHFAFYANGRVSWIEEIFVDENYRTQGIGRKLMHFFEGWCIERKSRLIGLATRRAAEFYKALDYNESATFFRKMI